MNRILPDSTDALNDDSVEVKRCRFCAGAVVEFTTEQIEHASFVASVTCKGCDAVVSTAYGADTESEALRQVKKLYNKHPRLKHKDSEDFPHMPVMPQPLSDGADQFELGHHQGRSEMWSECTGFMTALKDECQQLFDEGLGEHNNALFAIYRFFEMRRMWAESANECKALKAEIEALKMSSPIEDKPQD